MGGNSVDHLGKLLDEKLKPIQGELARINHELLGTKAEVAKVGNGIYRLEREVARLDSDVTTANEKLDALLVDVHGLQENVGAIWSKLDAVDDRHFRDQNEVCEHVGLEPLLPIQKAA